MILIFLGKGALFLWTLLALFFHETAHMLAAKSRGYLLGELTLMPYGACLWGEEKTDSRSMAYIAVAGPLANLVVLLAVMAVWWAFPIAELFSLTLSCIFLRKVYHKEIFPMRQSAQA